MNKTKPTLAQQTYEKVCAIESILNRVLADNSAPVPDPSPVSERPLYLATAGPEMPLSVIRLEDASDYATKSSKCNRRIKENFSRGFPAQAFSWAGID